MPTEDFLPPALAAEVDRLRRDAADAAALRLAFARAVETYPPSCPMPPAVQQWWQQLYDAVVANRAGLAVLAELAELRRQLKSQPPSQSPSGESHAP